MTDVDLKYPNYYLAVFLKKYEHEHVDGIPVELFHKNRFLFIKKLLRIQIVKLQNLPSDKRRFALKMVLELQGNVYRCSYCGCFCIKNGFVHEKLWCVCGRKPYKSNRDKLLNKSKVYYWKNRDSIRKRRDKKLSEIQYFSNIAITKIINSD